MFAAESIDQERSWNREQFQFQFQFQIQFKTHIYISEEDRKFYLYEGIS
jgi:hypothetical protein